MANADQLSPAKLVYFNQMMKNPNTDVNEALNYLNQLSDYQALASVSAGNLTPQEQAIISGTNGYAAVDLLANKYGITGPVTMGQGQTYATTPEKVSAQQMSTTSTPSNAQLVLDAYKSLGRTGVGTAPNQIDQGGLDYWTNELNSGKISPADFNKTFYQAVGNYYKEKPTDAITKYTAPVLQENAYNDLLTKAYGAIGRTGFGTDVKNIDQGGYNFWLNAMKSGQYNTNGQFDPSKFLSNFNASVKQYQVENPTSLLTKYVSQYAPVNVGSDMFVGGGVTPPAQTATVGQFKELFPSFGESKRLAGEMVANRPSMENIIAMLQGQGQQTPTTAPTGQAAPSLANVLSMISK